MFFIWYIYGHLWKASAQLVNISIFIPEVLNNFCWKNLPLVVRHLCIHDITFSFYSSFICCVYFHNFCCYDFFWCTKIFWSKFHSNWIYLQYWVRFNNFLLYYSCDPIIFSNIVWCKVFILYYILLFFTCQRGGSWNPALGGCWSYSTAEWTVGSWGGNLVEEGIVYGYTPLLEDAMAEAVLKGVETYVSLLQNTVTPFIATKPIMKLYMAA